MNTKTLQLIRHQLIGTAILIFMAPSLQAATIQWGGEVGSDFYLSDGTQVSSSNTPSLSLTFELGAFDPAFTPDETNLGDWRSNWRAIDTASFSLPNQYFSGEFVLTDQNLGISGVQYNGATFSPGEDLYIWAYNQLSVNTNMEWALMTGLSPTDDASINPSDNNWELPDPATSTQGSLPLSWRTSTANTAGFGSVPGSIGDGVITTPQSGDFQFATIIPEPSFSLYIGLFSLLGIVYRRRS